MQAGRLDRRVTFLQATVADDGLSESKTWADGATVWASKTDVSDGERARASQLEATITTRFQVRHSATTAAITVQHRLRCEGRTYEIKAKKELGRRDGYEFSCVAAVDGGGT